LTKTLTQNGIELWQHIAELMNSKVKQHGKLLPNDTDIWDNTLHQWTNAQWLLIISVMERLYEVHPEYFAAGHITSVRQCRDLILSHHGNFNRVMNQRDIGMDHKGRAWRGVCTFREVWNNVHGIDLPTEIRTRAHKATRHWQ
jgi:hypothetical protein